MANIYLIPTIDSTYMARIAEYSPYRNAVLLVAEGAYPTELWYVRHDLNMNGILAKVDVRNRESLLSHLNFLGECRHEVAELWSYGVKTAINGDASRLFKKCYNRKAELANEAKMEADTDDM